MKDVAIVRTGTANLASVIAALERAGATPRLIDGPDACVGADRVVLPGVGAFGAAMAKLAGDRLVDALVRRIADGRPTLAICLGLQLLAASSEETPGVPGLGVIPQAVTRITGAVRVPQLGWNLVEPAPGGRLLERGFAYFANSFCLRELPAGWSGAFADHGGRFVAAIERDNVLACQFHPELSGAWGARLIERWLEQTRC